MLITALLLLLLLAVKPAPRADMSAAPVNVVSIEASEAEIETAQSSPQQQDAARTPPSPKLPASEESKLPESAEPSSAPLPPAPAEPLPAPAVPRIGVRIRGGQAYGPTDRAGSASARDTERVGTAPNGEPLYAAAWYREPRDDELRGYLSTASGPGWGLIACRTAADYRVEDCVGLDEYPSGSQITRAVLAAAWAFRVRPPRLGGKQLVGAWVRIRIDYGTARR